MDHDIKKDMIHQYLKYFKVWFIAFAVVLVLTIITFIGNLEVKSNDRNNDQAPIERVYDYANVLSDTEEQQLRDLIAIKEIEIECDIVLVTINQEVGIGDDEWKRTMMNLADDFYDNNNYGYNGVHGDGVLLIDNWYEGQGGCWLSTCGKVLNQFGDYEIEATLEVVNDNFENPYEAYKAYINTVSGFLDGGKSTRQMMVFGSFIIATIVAGVFIMSHIKPSDGDNTTTSVTYVANGKPKINKQQDEFDRKYVTSRKIPQNTDSDSGGGGSHVSSSGVSHGGGGSRR